MISESIGRSEGRQAVHKLYDNEHHLQDRAPTTNDCHIAFCGCPNPNQCEVPSQVWRFEIYLHQSHKADNRQDDDAV